MPRLKKCIFVEDLLAVTFLSCLGVLFVMVPPFNETFFRVPLALSLFFFVPGYAFIAALFPGKNEISGIERFTLSVGFSLILTVFAGFLISLSPWGYRPTPIVVSILGITTFFSILAIFTRKLKDESEQFSFSLKEFIKSIQSDGADESPDEAEENPAAAESRRFYRSRSKVKAKGLKYQSGSETGTERKKTLPPEIEKALVIALIGSIIISGAMFAYAKMTREKETFTMLYILGPDGKAEGYPDESFINIPINITVGIENHELQSVNYVLQMKYDGDVIEELNVPIEDGETWQKNMTYIRHNLKNGRSKLEFALFKDKPDYFPYRSVHLYIENNNTFSHLDDSKYTEASELPKIVNGEMESSTGWTFTSNSEYITGSYASSSGVISSYAYRIVNSYEGNLSDSAEFGEISQTIECKEDTMAVLSAYVRDDFNLTSQGTDSQLKYAAVNGKVVWSDGISEAEGWQHLEVPIAMQAGMNNLTLGLRQLPGVIVPVEVFWDSVSLKPLADISPYVSESGTVEAVPPVSRVLELPAYTNNKTFTVSWNGTDEGSGIDYYSIDSSTDGVNWETWISRTTDNSSVFSAEDDQTYYFRSKAVDRAGNKEPDHPGPDTQTKVYTGAPRVMLDITPNPCKTATTFNVTYSLPLQSVVCRVGLEGFEPESFELTSADGVHWTGNYIVRNGDRFSVQAECTDTFGNIVYAFDEILVDSSAPNFEIEVTPAVIDKGNLKIKVTPSSALKSKPSVSISANEKIEVTYLTYSDGDYYYTANIKSEINEGSYKVSVTGYDLGSEKVEGNTTFVVDRSL
ncbi:MAG: DUF1616 domain-containing protein [Euryarchaeota archaeon]|nr:DUF1616 domain-containing protein [Euryarchaeota archaeon]